RLIAGSIGEIRSYVYQHNTGPIADFDFSADRQHWIHRNASDRGWPIKGKWSIWLEKNNPQIIGPEGCWDADKYPVMEITAAFRTNEPTANIEFLPFDNGKKSVSKHVSFKVINDGKMHTYRVNLSDSPDYRGAIVKFSLLPCKKSGAGQFVKLKKIRLLR
ncbi:MAG: hypothetical protein JRJ87_26705, partial [Deltaproteobacteria bacterium]|nr:hypothetical protein [Deltaproteobacteria bacterium]